MELKDQIRIHREAAGMSRIELAQALNPPVSEQSIIWWETGEHRPRMTRIGDINRALGVVLDVSEQGDAKKIDTNGQISALDPDVIRLAQHISRLPKALREAIEIIAAMGNTLATGKKASPFVETLPTPRPPSVEVSTKAKETKHGRTSESKTEDKRRNVPQGA